MKTDKEPNTRKILIQLEFSGSDWEDCDDIIDELMVEDSGIAENMRRGVGYTIMPKVLPDLEAAEKAIPKWISVDDKLPPDNALVLIHTRREYENSPTVIIGRYHGEFWYSAAMHEDEDILVTHWMPLPPPPAEG